MKFIRGLQNIRPEHANCVATIGSFDGLHLGHQAVLNQLITKSKELGLPSLVITFEPLPKEYFLKDKAPARLLTLRDKLELLKQYKIDRVLCLRFNKNLANFSAEEFVEKILVEKLAVKYLIAGDDFKFGKNRAGDFALLQRLGSIHHFTVTDTESVKLDNTRIGSSFVRTELAQGNFPLAQKLLGRAFSISGRVVHGDKRGRELGYPTANLPLRRRIIPILGIFAVRIHGLQQRPLLGAASIGNRPMFDGTRYWLEVYIFDFNQTIYGRRIQVEFIAKIRDEQRFDSIEELKQQMAQDVISAKKILKISDFS